MLYEFSCGIIIDTRDYKVLRWIAMAIYVGYLSSTPQERSTMKVILYADAYGMDGWTLDKLFQERHNVARI